MNPDDIIAGLLQHGMPDPDPGFSPPNLGGGLLLPHGVDPGATLPYTPGAPGIRGIDPSQAQLATQNPMPMPKKPAILDRILGRLFPVDPQYGTALSPEQQHGVQMQALQRLASGLLSQSGWHPVGAGPTFGEAIGKSMAGVDLPELLKGAAGTSMALQDRQKLLDQDQKTKDILSGFKPQPGESLQQSVARLLSQLVQSGDIKAVPYLAELAKSMGGDHGFRIEDRMGPDGKMHTYRIFENGAPQDIGLTPAKNEEVAFAHEATRGNMLETRYDAEVKPLREGHMWGAQGLRQAKAAIAGDPGAQYTLLHNFLKSQDPQAVVRPGTARLIQEAQSLAQQFEARSQDYLSGKSHLLSPSFAKQITRVLSDQLHDIEAKWNDVYGRSVRKAKDWKLDSSLYLDKPDAFDFSGVDEGDALTNLRKKYPGAVKP